MASAMSGRYPATVSPGPTPNRRSSAVTAPIRPGSSAQSITVRVPSSSMPTMAGPVREACRRIWST